MTAREHKVSRRVLLGAACAIPLIRHPGPDPGPTFSSLTSQNRGIPGRARNDGAAASFAVTKYDRAFAAFRIAEAAVNAAAGEPDEDRAVYPERPQRGLSKGRLRGRLNDTRSLS